MLAIASCATPTKSTPPVPTQAAQAPMEVPPPAPDAAPLVADEVDVDAGPWQHPDRDPDAPDDVGAIPDDAVVSPSGLAYRIISTPAPNGEVPGENDQVTVNFRMWTTDGVKVDENRNGTPQSFVVSKVIRGWKEGLMLMRVGETARLWVPEDLAYKGMTGPQGMIVLDVELLAVIKAPKPPADVAKPPRKARRLKKGVRYLVVARGAGKQRPRNHDRVEVHYTGWTTDGVMFDSSVMRGKPSAFAVNRVIEGWTIALQRMRVGDKWILWIPKQLAYDGKPGRPEGMLVFEV